MVGKIHKDTRNGLPPFHPILAATGTPIYKLAKFLLHFLTPSTLMNILYLIHFTLWRKFANRTPSYAWLV